MKTVKVRIAVAISETGYWNASGWKQPDSDQCDKIMMDTARDTIDGEVVKTCFIEAEIPIPETETIRGEITDL